MIYDIEYRIKIFQTLLWLLVALHLSAAKPNLNMKDAASVYLCIKQVRQIMQSSQQRRIEMFRICTS